ncbi:MAG TPA: winged helix-turn-helix domain-containing protein [Candidatus Acidoferrum sp.]|nr:winged helix-turn-helix domain-containing protein [Candidatus Acidoferrum sp.]
MFSNTSRGDAQPVFGRVWNFANCEFDDSCLELRVGGVPVDLELKPLEVLLQLLIHAGEVVSKERLLDSVWPGLLVVDGSLATAVSKLRKALGDADSSIVLTIPRVGYRLGVPVHSRQVLDSPAEATLSFCPGDSVPGREHWRMVRALPTPESREVWLAENPKTHELRVFKFALRGGRLKSLKREVTVSRFLRESLGERADFGRLLEWNFEKQPYSLEIEYGGPNLVEWAASQGGLGKIPLDTRLGVLADIASTVADAHRAGVVHKDLKPANILVTTAVNGGWQIKVVDFGSAVLTEPERLQALGITNLGLTQTAGPQASSLTGTLLYLAPEVLSGHASTASADVYSLGVMLYQIVVGDFRRPLSPGWEGEIEDPLLREDIAKAACGDPGRRLSSAEEVAARLRNLDQRHIELRRLEQKEAQDELARQRQAHARVRRPWMVLAVVALAVAIVVSFTLYRKVFSVKPHVATVALLPFRNAVSDPSADFLRFALPDEIATALSHMRPLAVRPFSANGKYAQGAPDLQQVGREMGANSVVTGDFLLVGEHLQITIEAVDVETNRLRWRDTVNVPAGNLLALQAQIAATSRGKLAPALGASELVRETPANPQNEEAYDLYLRTVSIPYDPEPNKRAIAMLEQSVKLDRGYPPAWLALSLRYYRDGREAEGGEPMLVRSDEACERALALDPDSLDAANELALHRAERGDLARAYREAQELVRRRPDSAVAHHLLSYVLRYAGVLDEAGRQCDITTTLDPQVGGSCSATFMETGNYKHALDYVRKDFSSEWSKAHGVDILVRQGGYEEALKVGAPRNEWESSYRMLLACVQHKPAAEVAALAAQVQSNDDPEVSYFFAGHLAYCGQAEPALRILDSAVRANYCSYPAMDSDPLFANVRGRREFGEIRSRAVACNRRFLSETKQKY